MPGSRARLCGAGGLSEPQPSGRVLCEPKVSMRTVCRRGSGGRSVASVFVGFGTVRAVGLRWVDRVEGRP